MPGGCADRGVGVRPAVPPPVGLGGRVGAGPAVGPGRRREGRAADLRGGVRPAVGRHADVGVGRRPAPAARPGEGPHAGPGRQVRRGGVPGPPGSQRDDGPVPAADNRPGGDPPGTLAGTPNGHRSDPARRAVPPAEIAGYRRAAPAQQRATGRRCLAGALVLCTGAGAMPGEANRATTEGLVRDATGRWCVTLDRPYRLVPIVEDFVEDALHLAAAYPGEPWLPRSPGAATGSGTGSAAPYSTPRCRLCCRRGSGRRGSSAGWTRAYP